jgi:hypothetical protein
MNFKYKYKMTAEYYADIVIKELTKDGAVYFARFEETSTKKMAMNRSKRIHAINIYLCKDLESQGFKNWELHENIQNPNKCLCICGMELEKEAYYLMRKDGSCQICIGSKCIEEMEKEFKSNIQDEIQNDKDERKVCPFCNKRKAMNDKMCKKCSACSLCEMCKTPNFTSDYGLCKPCWFKKREQKHKCANCTRIIDAKYIKCYTCNKSLNL